MYFDIQNKMIVYGGILLTYECPANYTPLLKTGPRIPCGASYVGYNWQGT